MKKITTLIFIFTISYFNLLNAQDSESKWGFGFGYALTPAPGILNDNGYGTHHGLFADINYLGIRNKFFSFSPGMRFNFGTSYGDRVDVRVPEPDIEIGNARMTNSFTDLRLGVRVTIFENWLVKPYSEFLVGFRHSSANQIFSLNGDVDSNDDVGGASNRDNINRKFSHIYGLGIGAMISVSDIIAIDLRVSRDRVGSLTYLNLDEDINSNFFVADDVRTMSYSVGLRVRLSCDKDSNTETID